MSLNQTSEHDRKKKNAEIVCLENAIKNLNHERDKEVYTLLSGNLIDREEDEKPDFITVCNIDGRKILCGIEHFMADRLSTLKTSRAREKTESSGRFFDNAYNEKKEKYSNKSKLHKLFIALTKELRYVLSTANKQASSLYSIPRAMLHESLRISLQHHSNQKDRAYEVSLNEIDAHCKKNYILLVELRLRNYNLFLHKDGKWIKFDKIRQKSIPDDVLSVLVANENYLSKFDYIILCIYDESENETQNVISFKPYNIVEQLKESNVLIYRYVGDDDYESNMQGLTYGQLSSINTFSEHAQTSKKIITNIGGEEYKNRQADMFRKITEYEKSEIPYVTTLGAQKEFKKYLKKKKHEAKREEEV